MDRKTKNSLIDSTKSEFYKVYNSKFDFVSIAPGRVNIIGEHTDYNLGLAMPVAIDKWICIASRKRNDNKINIFSSNLNDTINTNIDNLEPKKLWHNYVIGCFSVLKDKFNIDKGVDVFINGNIPIGSGLSSSAALEVSLIGVLLKTFKINFSLNDILNLSHNVEIDYLKINSGLLDQYASIFASNNPVLIDFSTLKHSHVNSKINNSSWILFDSKIRRELVSSKYNQRVSECLEGLKKINKKLSSSKKINELNLSDLNLIKDDEINFNRLSHVINENKRVVLMKNALENGDNISAGKILNNSHSSLSKLYDVSCKEIDFLIKISKITKGYYGGRIMGGGFGGCTLNLIESLNKDEIIKTIIKEFEKKYNYIPDVIPVEFSKGFEILF